MANGPAKAIANLTDEPPHRGSVFIRAPVIMNVRKVSLDALEALIAINQRGGKQTGSEQNILPDYDLIGSGCCSNPKTTGLIGLGSCQDRIRCSETDQSTLDRTRTIRLQHRPSQLRLRWLRLHNRTLGQSPSRSDCQRSRSNNLRSHRSPRPRIQRHQRPIPTPRNPSTKLPLRFRHKPVNLPRSHRRKVMHLLVA